MRFVVLLFGFFGSLLTVAGGLAFFAFDAARDLLTQIAPGVEVPDWALLSPTGFPLSTAGLFWLIAGGFGLLGTIFGFLRCGRQGALLMLIPVCGAAYVHPYAAAFASLQVFTALLSLFVGPLPIVPKNED